MGCTSCGTDANLVKLLMEKFLNDALRDGTIQAGLKDCMAQKLEKSTQVITCASLEQAMCQLAEDGRLCVQKLVSADYKDDTDELVLIMSDGSTIKTTISAGDKDTHIKSARLNPQTGKVTFSYNRDDMPPIELDLSQFDQGLTVTKKADGTIVLTRKDGTTEEIAPVRKGDKGDKGDTGAQGAVGPQGPKGDKGEKGDRGPAGAAGSVADIPPRTLRLVNSSGEVVVGYAYTTERDS